MCGLSPRKLTALQVREVGPLSPHRSAITLFWHTADLNFCELEVWAANSCPTRASPNASPVAGSTCTGATLGSQCVQTCNGGFTAVAGAANATCLGSSWDQTVRDSGPLWMLHVFSRTQNAALLLQDLVCEPLCPVPTPPTPLGTCTQSLFAESFSNATSAASRFTSVVALQPIGTAWQFVDGTVQATGTPGCITSGLVMVATSASVQSYSDIFNVSATLQTAYSAGLVFFAAPDGSSYYALTLNATAGAVSIQVGPPT